MAEEPTAIEKLEAIVRRPAMYWGNSDNHFHSLLAFISGYSCARHESSDPDSLIPDDFHQFVTHYYLGEWRLDGGKGWMTFIEQHTGSDEEALQKFLELRKEYESADLEKLRV